MAAVICRCGHGRTAHEHYRQGTDCAACSCAKFRRRSWWSIAWGRA